MEGVSFASPTETERYHTVRPRVIKAPLGYAERGEAGFGRFGEAGWSVATCGGGKGEEKNGAERSICESG